MIDYHPACRIGHYSEMTGTPIETHAELDAARSTVSACLDKLTAFDTRDALAAELAAELAAVGLRAECGNANRCAIALHVWATTGYAVSVNAHSIALCDIGRRLQEDIWVNGSNPDQVPTPDLLAEFIEAFDRKAYPELMADTVRDVFAGHPGLDGIDPGIADVPLAPR